MARVPRSLRALLATAAFLSGACAGLGPGGRPEATRENRLDLVADLLEMEDRRDYDPLRAGRAASSKDPWVRSRAALACGRLRDVEASVQVAVLLGDPDPDVRRAAAFAAGISGDRRLAPLLARALADPDAGSAEAAATALGRLGGEEAERALRAVLAGPAEGPREAAAGALFRVRDPEVVPLFAAALAGRGAAVRKAAVYALARIPRPGTEEHLRGILDDADPEVASWAARGLGILGDAVSAERLVALARGPEAGPAIQALLALERIAAKGMSAPAREAGLARWRDARPGVAVAALTLLRRAPGDAEVVAALAEAVAMGGRRGGVALASLAALDPAAARALAFPPGGAPLELRLGAAEAISLVPEDEQAAWLDLLLADPVPRVRMEAVSRLPREAAARHASGIVRALGDPDGAVKAAALDAAAPIASGPSADPAVADAWRRAYDAALASREPDLVASALDAAASLAEGGRLLVAARRDAADDLVRARARRLLVERFGEDPGSFAHRGVATGRSRAAYRRLAAAAETSRFVATVATSRGVFTVELLPEAAPATVESFISLARRGFFDGTTIHRVVPDFVVQAGDPRGDGTGGPGYALRDELNPIPYVRGRVGMALSGPDTGGSQWFVTLSRQAHLDAGYTVFGEVASGMEVLDRIEQDDRLVSVRVTEGTREAPPGLAAPSR